MFLANSPTVIAPAPAARPLYKKERRLSPFPAVWTFCFALPAGERPFCFSFVCLIIVNFSVLDGVSYDSLENERQTAVDLFPGKNPSLM
jgi:hypothetical protein